MASDTNTVPDVGSDVDAPIIAFAKARGKSRSMPMTSPVERISGPRIESTARPSTVRKRRNGRTASLTATGWSSSSREPSPDCGSSPPRSCAIERPTASSAAAFASWVPVLFATKGTVREARGFASMT